MSRAGSGTTRMICSNKGCINKSVVYRKLDHIRDANCKFCNEPLTRLVNKVKIKQDLKAKRELKELDA